MDKGTPARPRPWVAVGQELTDLLQQVDSSRFSALADTFHDTERRWFFSGQGRSGYVAQMIAMRFMHLGRTAHYIGEATAPAITSGDGLLIVSGSGETPITLGYAKIARSAGALIVAVTRRPLSPLGIMADLVLPVPDEATNQPGGNLFEQASLILLDSVVMELSDGMEDAPALMAQRHTNFL